MSVEPGPIPPDNGADGSPDEPAGFQRVDVGRAFRLSMMAAGAVAAVCLVGGLIWGLVVPGVTGIVVSPGEAGALGGDTGHRFDAVATFTCISFVAGIIGGVGVWWLREIRGSFGAVATALGAVAGSAAGIWLGGLIAGARHPGPVGTAVGQFFQSAPSLRLSGAALEGTGGFVFAWAIVVIAPIGGLLAYLVAMLAVRRADLGVGDVRRADAASRTRR